MTSSPEAADAPVADFGPVLAEKTLEARLDPALTTVFRLDGVNFSAFVRAAKCVRPFDPQFTAWMTKTFQALMTTYRFHAGFHGSDELSLVWYGVHERHLSTTTTTAAPAADATAAPTAAPTDPATFVLPFSGRVQKLCSVLAGKASAAFAAALMEGDHPRPDLLRLMPAFDCRVWQVGTPREALAGLHLRQVYVLKNARMMYAQHYFPHKALEKVASKAAADLVATKLGADHAFEAAVPAQVRVGVYGLWAPTLVAGRDGPVMRNKLALTVHFGTLVTTGIPPGKHLAGDGGARAHLGLPHPVRGPGVHPVDEYYADAVPFGGAGHLPLTELDAAAKLTDPVMAPE